MMSLLFRWALAWPGGEHGARQRIELLLPRDRQGHAVPAFGDQAQSSQPIDIGGPQGTFVRLAGGDTLQGSRFVIRELQQVRDVGSALARHGRDLVGCTGQ